MYKIFDQDGNLRGTLRRNGNVFEAIDKEDKPILRDELGNKVPGSLVYFFDYYGNIIRYSSIPHRNWD